MFLKVVGLLVKFEVYFMVIMGDRDKIIFLLLLGKGLWISELEVKLVNKEVDVIVYLFKDMLMSLLEGCVFGVVM